MKPLIITLTGESGTGKTLTADYIEKVYLIKMIQSYTDRRPRFEGEQGHTFISKLEFDLFDEKDMIAFTKFGDNRYCCLKSDILSLNTYVIDEAGLDYLEHNFKDDYNIIKIRLKRDLPLRREYVSDERLKRDYGRYKRPEETYQYVVSNNQTKEDLYLQIDRILNNIFSKLQ